MPVSGAVLTNLDGLTFQKGYIYLTREGGTADAVGFGALQNINLSHTFAFSELSGPESLSPLGVGIQSESLTGTWDYGVITPEQFLTLIGGSQVFSTPNTVYTKLVNEEPLPFDLHFESGVSGSDDMDLYLYRCLSDSVSLRGENRTFSIGSGSFRCYGQDVTTYGANAKLFTFTRPGNLTNSS